jgi:hypothetical protein
MCNVQRKWKKMELTYEVLFWLTDRWFTATYPRSLAHALAWQRRVEYVWGVPAMVRRVRA